MLDKARQRLECRIAGKVQVGGTLLLRVASDTLALKYWTYISPQQHQQRKDFEAGVGAGGGAVGEQEGGDGIEFGSILLDG